LLSLVSPSLRPQDSAAVALFATHVGSALEVAEHVETLQRTQEELLARERLATIGEIAATVAHEVRNPLAGLFNAVAALSRPNQKDKKRRMQQDDDAEVLLSFIGEETERLNAIVTDLLEFARPQAMRIMPTSLADLVRDTTKGLKPQPDTTCDVRL